MSWLRSAVNRAVEVGGNNNLSRTVRNYADTVVQHAGQAVAGGARILHDRMAARNLRSFALTAKRLEEVSVSCRGEERILLLRRWLVALKEIERYIDDNNNSSEQQQSSDESKDSAIKPLLVLYYDPVFGGELLNFRDVFLHSQALEGITLSMILQAPNEEEVSLLGEIFGLCITGGKEVHKSILSGIQYLANVSSRYEDEVLVKREELLQYAQSAIAGLKINAARIRLDTEASSLQKKLDEIKSQHQQLSIENAENVTEKPIITTIEALQNALSQIRLCSKLEELMLKKKSIKSGDSPETYAKKVEKLKILSESLASSASKAEDRILDHKSQKEEAFKFRVARSNEVGQVEKELAMEIEGLEKQKFKLEAELKRVNTSLTAALARLNNAKEEREQFDEASDQIVAHFKTKEDELARSIDTYRAEADAVNAWVSFLEDTWVLQTSYEEQIKKQVNDELERYGDYFVNLTTHLLSVYKKELVPLISCTRTLVENLNFVEGARRIHIIEDKTRKNLEEQYLDSEAKLITMFSVVDSMRKLFHMQEGVHRKDDQMVKELFDDVDKHKDEFESIERPYLQIETPRQPVETQFSETLQYKETPQTSSSFTPRRFISPKPKPTFTLPDFEQDELLESVMIKGGKALNPEAALSKLTMEFGKHSLDFSQEDICEWEFDELEQDLNTNTHLTKG